MTTRESMKSKRGEEWVIIQFVLLALIVWSPEFLHLEFPSPLKFLGLPLAVASLVLGIPSFFHLGKAISPFPKPVDKAHLVTSGPYHLVRHPMYFSVFLLMSGWGFWSGNLTRLFLSLVLLAFYNRKSRFEKELLEKTYPEYKAYRNCVKKRLIPWIYVFAGSILTSAFLDPKPSWAHGGDFHSLEQLTEHLSDHWTELEELRAHGPGNEGIIERKYAEILRHAWDYQTFAEGKMFERLAFGGRFWSKESSKDKGANYETQYRYL